APAVRRAPRRPGPPLTVPSSSPEERAGAAPGAPSAGRRGERPAASDAATIDPAEVPTKASVRRRSAPVASSIPARTPVIHASPKTPPPESTRMSGGANTGTTRTLVTSAYAITYARNGAHRRDGDPDPHRASRPRAAGGDGPLAARPRRAVRRLRPDAEPGRARRNEPDAADRQPDRRGARAAAQPAPAP